MSKVKDGKLCVYNKLHDMKFQDELTKTFSFVSTKSPITPEDCLFDKQVINLCGSYEAVTSRLTKAGYIYNWQGNLDEDYKLTMLTKGQQSFYLKTDRKTGATIFTGVGKGEYTSYSWSQQ